MWWVSGIIEKGNDLLALELICIGRVFQGGSLGDYKNMNPVHVGRLYILN